MQSTFEHIKERAIRIGFADLGVTPVGPLLHEREALHSWLEKGYAGQMDYMRRTEEVRGDLEKFLPGARTVLVGTVNYWNDEVRVGNEDLGAQYPKDPSVFVPSGHTDGAQPPSLGREGKVRGKVARYAYGRDYHKVIRKMLEELRDTLVHDAFPDSTEDDYRVSLDAHPVMERAWARRAGLGFLGKNGCLITKGEGSWVLIGCLVTRVEIGMPDRKSAEKDFSQLSCGNCTRCISKCPTGAIVADGVIDANRCISYLTIENREGIPEDLREAVGDRLFGCDICQEVCPYNARREHFVKNPFAEKPIAGDSLSIRELLSIRSEQEFTSRFAGSPLMRAKWRGMLRNACVVAGNSGDASLVRDLEKFLERCDDAMVREHAQWAIGKLSRE